MDNSRVPVPPTEPLPPKRWPPPAQTAVDHRPPQSSILPAIFYAVWRPQGELRAIFISEKEETKWDTLLQEFKEFVENEKTAEVQAFTKLEDAAHYLLNNSNDGGEKIIGTTVPIPNPALPEEPATKHPPASAGNEQRKKSPSASPLPGPPTKKTKVSHKKAAKLEILEKDSTHFETMLQEFKEYQKASNTTTKPKQSPALRDWAQRIRFQFQKLQEGKASNLTPERIQKLNDAGFVFCPRSNFRQKTWDERLEQLQEYKLQHGHLNIPSNHPELGCWTSNIRRAFKYLKEGKKTGFTEEKAAILAKMGFSFLVGKRKEGPINVKTWDEQFESLLDFKLKFGHTVVPQHYPVLGRWVKQMRREFKLMKEGKRSTMTPEKVLKLADIGFVFDAQFRRGSKISAENFTKVGGKKNGDQGG